MRLKYADTGLLGTAPPDPLLLADIVKLSQQIDLMAAKFPVATPWTAPNAARYDAETLETWVRGNAVNANGILAMLAPFTEALVGAEPRDVSFLFVLGLCRRRPATRPIREPSSGCSTCAAARSRAGWSAARSSSRRGSRPRSARGSPGHAGARIEHTASGVTVSLADSTVHAKQVIVAVPPPLAARIDYAPLLPAARDLLTQRLAMGALMKVEAVYPTPFWRAAKLTGQFLTVGGPVGYAFDNSPPDGAPGVLAGFVGGTQNLKWGPTPAADRRHAVLTQYARIFADDRFLHPSSTSTWTGRARSGAAAGRPPSPGRAR